MASLQGLAAATLVDQKKTAAVQLSHCEPFEPAGFVANQQFVPAPRKAVTHPHATCSGAALVATVDKSSHSASEKPPNSPMGASEEHDGLLVSEQLEKHGPLQKNMMT